MLVSKDMPRMETQIIIPIHGQIISADDEVIKVIGEADSRDGKLSYIELYKDGECIASKYEVDTMQSNLLIVEIPLTEYKELSLQLRAVNTEGREELSEVITIYVEQNCTT